MRIVSLCPSNTELIGYLQCEHLLVGVDNYSDWPNSVQKLPRLGPDLSIDMDLVEELKPDLILASLSVPGMERNIEELKKRNLPFVTLNPQSLSDIRNDLLTVGDLIGVGTYAEKIVQRFDKEITYYKELAQRITHKPNIYWEWWPKPLFTPGGSNWLTEISALAGAKNMFEDYSEPSVQTTWEEVKKRKPQAICLAWVGIAEKNVNKKVIQKRSGWEELRLSETDIHILEEALFCRPSPRLLVGLKKLAQLLHPAIFKEDKDEDVLLSVLKGMEVDKP